MPFANICTPLGVLRTERVMLSPPVITITPSHSLLATGQFPVSR